MSPSPNVNATAAPPVAELVERADALRVGVTRAETVRAPSMPASNTGAASRQGC